MQRIVRTILVLAGMAAAGCGSAGDEGMLPGGPGLGSDGMMPPSAEAKLGTGTVFYEPVVEGQEVPLYMGPQGGYHFLMHVQMRGMTFGDARNPEDPDNPVTEFSAYSADNARIDLRRGLYELGYRPIEGGWGELPSGKIIEIRNELASALLGTNVTLRVQITDIEGVMAEDIVRVRVADEFAR